MEKVVETVNKQTLPKLKKWAKSKVHVFCLIFIYHSAQGMATFISKIWKFLNLKHIQTQKEFEFKYLFL